MTRVKFCGMRRIEDAEFANQLMPDYVGFIFARGRKRYITPETAETLRKALDRKIKTVGVFVDEAPEYIAQLCACDIFDIIQLHGKEDDTYIAKLRTMTDKPIIKAIRLENETDCAVAESCTADLVLLDAGNGGTGEVFDWSLTKKIKREFILAGGLTHENVFNAVSEIRPMGVDVSSGTETDGIKDFEKMKAFITAVHSADNKEE